MVVPDYDTDDISVTSTQPEEEQEFWSVEDILAEHKADDGSTKYLIRWEGFPLHDSTWEPFAHIQDTDLPNIWAERKASRSEGEFRRYNAGNINAFNSALEDAVQARLARVEKRAKKRERLPQRKLSPDARSESEDDEIPLVRRKLLKDVPKSDKRTTREESNLFVGPFEQSDSSEDEGPIVRRRPLRPITEVQGPSRNTASKQPSPDERQKSVQGQPILSEKNRPRRRASLSSSGSIDSIDLISMRAANKPQRKGNATSSKSLERRDSNSNSALLNKITREKGAPSTSSNNASRRDSSIAKPTRSETLPTTSSTSKNRDITPEGRRKSVPSITAGKPAPKSAPSAQGVASSETGPAKKITAKIKRSGMVGPISIVNRVPDHRRAEWHNSEGLYGKLSTRRKGQLRATKEATPDFTTLTWANGTPPGLRKRPPQPRDNPYGRREAGRRREKEVEEEPEEPKPSETGSAKIPLSCWEWRNNSCQRGADKCHFMHSANYPPSPMDGSIPPKYRTPAHTCFHYMENPWGCNDSDEKCGFAHWNTGWLAKPGVGLTQIESWRKPASAAMPTPHFTPHGNVNKPPRVNLTCYFWMHGTCRNGASCGYAHEDTGHIAPKPPGWVEYPNQQSSSLRQQYMPRRGSAERHGGTPQHHGGTPQSGGTPQHVGTSQHESTTQPGDSGFDRRERDSIPTINEVIEPVPTEVAVPVVPEDPIPFPFKKTAPAPIKDAMSVLPGDPIPSPLEKAAPMISEDPIPSPFKKALPITTEDVLPARSEEAVPARSEDLLPASSKTSVEQAVDEPAHPPPSLSCEDLNIMIESIFRINYENVFGDAHDMEKMLDPLAFVLFHPENEREELDLLTRWLLMHHVEVCLITMDGSWEYFVEKVEAGSSGVILASPDYHEHWDLPNFWKITQSHCRIWSVGYQAHENFRSSRTIENIEPETNTIEIFPLGGFIYITDEVFEKRPDLAYQIIKKFVEKIEVLRDRVIKPDDSYRVVDAFIIWRLLVRPNFMDWTRKWIAERSDLLAADDPTVQARANIWWLLHHCNYISQDPTPADQPEDFWPVISENGPHTTEHEERLQRNSQQEADFFGIEGYGLMMMGDELRRSYRHFYVVHMEPETVRHWQKDLQHISDVITPERCIEYLDESESVQSFDAKFAFGEWELEVKDEGESCAFDWADESYWGGLSASGGGDGDGDVQMEDEIAVVEERGGGLLGASNRNRGFSVAESSEMDISDG